MSVIEKTVEKLVSSTEAKELERIASYRLSDAMREGSKVSNQAYTWSDGDALCALSSAACAAKARKYL